MRVADARSRKRRSHLYAGLTLAVIASIGLFQPTPAHAGVLEDILGAVSAVGLGVTLTPIVFVSYLILALSSIILGWVGILFNYAVANLVFDFGHFFGNTAGMLAAWGVLRDIGNIALLFGFIFMGLQTILDIGHFSVGKALPRFLIFAVLMNFSLFAAEAVIDVSNALASSLYKQTEVGNCATVTGNRNDCNVQYGISGMILDRAGIGSVLSNKSAKDFVEGTQAYFKDPIGQIVNYLGLAMVVTTTWVVLLAGAVLLIARGIQLALLMITSPIGFAGMAIPPLEEQARKWWKSLFSQAFFAPVYLLLIFVGLKVTESVTNLTGKPDLSAALQSTNALDMQPLLVYALIIGFMIAALLAAKKFGIAGADIITKTATGTIGNIAAGGIGFAYRRTAGTMSNAGARAIRRSSIGGTEFGRFAAGVVGVGANKSFDLRGAGLSKVAGADFGSAGKAAKGGITGIMHAEEEKRMKWDKEYKKDQKMEFEEIENEMDRAKRLKEDAERKRAAALEKGDAGAADRYAKDAERYGKRADDLHHKADATIYGQQKKLEDDKKKAEGAQKSNDDKVKEYDQAIKNLGAQIAAATAAGNGDLVRALESQRAETTKSRDAAKANSESLKKNIDNLTRQIQESQMRYAADLERAAEQWKYLPLSIGKNTLRQAAIEIRDNVKTSKKDKLLKDLESALDKEGSHAPAAAPAADVAHGPAH